MVDELEPGDQLELPGPIGGYLVWARALASPMLVVPGGSGVVPLRAMLRHHVAAHSPATMRLLYSARSPRDLVYGQELSPWPMSIPESTSSSPSPNTGPRTGTGTVDG